jgi:hypothetical protein
VVMAVLLVLFSIATVVFLVVLCQKHLNGLNHHAEEGSPDDAVEVLSTGDQAVEPSGSPTGQPTATHQISHQISRMSLV